LDWFQYLDYVVSILAGVSFIIGFVCYGFIGPTLIERYGDRSKEDTGVLTFLLTLEKELKNLATTTGNKIIIKTIIIINICKYSILVYSIFYVYHIFNYLSVE
jgi:hypothetical protein